MKQSLISMQVMPFLFFQTDDDQLKWVRKNGHCSSQQEQQLSFSVCESLSSEFMALECVRGRHCCLGYPVSLLKLSCSWEFQKRLTCHLCVVVSKIRVWKRDFKQSAIIEGAYLNVFFMSTLGRFFSQMAEETGNWLQHTAFRSMPNPYPTMMIYLIKRFSTQMDRKYAD